MDDTMISAQYISERVQQALAEDVGAGDITASLIAPDALASADVITREAGVLCGKAFADETFQQVDARCRTVWQVADGDHLNAGDSLFRVTGPARALLTAERTALNFLQALSGTATVAKDYADRVAHTDVRLLDTRKTVPGLRLAQKYAVACGGCYNHRIGLFDAFLIKENHIAAAGGIREAIVAARHIAADTLIEIEVETLEELDTALSEAPDRIMLDNFPLAALREAVARTAGHAELEASGNITDHTLVAIAETGVDLISIGALTKHIRALDLSMRLT
jgi:nicotinate-nucleotide pyrophosphorylase (carboxylating)